ncbi:uncharacterized protein MELLADRAFT_114125 [Melampsora larici-populina 98AG31]|uniref:Uncharacterized protein n=1 Tax=Melampsora larici-populina (strain 98AG31 / pathotype 3-4-7) TaxID=747676 RepID=F4SC92_MELLP|nr:uncharacterized protein MELLADRAFT_114125 [Melampsora larici-populina 98AG31]EGF97741.1 hypothetical protein MELLADRAFT_114125 [Melampsora larici-populina 98AG31]
MDDKSSVEYNKSSTDIEKHSEDTNQSHSDIDESTENIDESNEELDEHTEDLDEHTEDPDELTEDLDEHTEDVDGSTRDTNGSSDSEIFNETYNSKRARSPVEEPNKRHRHIHTANPSGTISVIPGKGKKRQLSQDSKSRPLRRSTQIQSSSGSSVTSYTSQRIIPATSTKKKRKMTHPHMSSSQHEVGSESSIIEENAGSSLIHQLDSSSNAPSISNSPARSDSNSTVRGFPDASQFDHLPKNPKITVFVWGIDVLLVVADELEKTLCNSFIRRGLFQSVLNNTSALLSRVDDRIRDIAVATLTGLHVPVWSKLTSIDQLTTYHTWLNYLNSDIDGRYGAFENKFENTTTTDRPDQVLQDHVWTIQKLNIDGKFYNSAKSSKPHEGNTLVEFWLRKQKSYGRIKAIFRTSLIPTNFLQIEPFTELSAFDAKLNLYSSYPGLHATVLYDKPAPQVVVDVKDMMGHFAAVFNLENTFGISQKTVSIVSLRNSVSFWSMFTAKHVQGNVSDYLNSNYDLLAAEIPATCKP